MMKRKLKLNPDTEALINKMEISRKIRKDHMNSLKMLGWFMYGSPQYFWEVSTQLAEIDYNKKN